MIMKQENISEGGRENDTYKESTQLTTGNCTGQNYIWAS